MIKAVGSETPLPEAAYPSLEGWDHNGAPAAGAVGAFRARGYVESAQLCSGGQSLDFQSLPPLLRVLLLQDGTVPKTLEAYFWEPVSVSCLHQFVSTGVLGVQRETAFGAPGSSSAANEEQLSSVREKALSPIAAAIDRSAKVLYRSVEIIGKHSGACYCKAFSTILLDQFPKEVSERLLCEEIGIGEILRDRTLETYRELGSFSFKHISPCKSKDFVEEKAVPGNTESASGGRFGARFSGSPDRGISSDLEVSREYRIFYNHLPSIAIREIFPLRVFL